MIRLLEVLRGKKNLIIVLPTGGGKSMIFMVPAKMENGRVTVVIVPFLALRQDLDVRCRAIGISPLWWKNGERGQSSLVLVTTDQAATSDFRSYLGSLMGGIKNTSTSVHCGDALLDATLYEKSYRHRQHSCKV